MLILDFFFLQIIFEPFSFLKFLLLPKPPFDSILKFSLILLIKLVQLHNQNQIDIHHHIFMFLYLIQSFLAFNVSLLLYRYKPQFKYLSHMKEVYLLRLQLLHLSLIQHAFYRVKVKEFEVLRMFLSKFLVQVFTNFIEIILI